MYAPNGAAVKYGVSYNLSNSITCLDFYITDKTIFEIIQYQLKNHSNGVGYDTSNIEDYLDSKDTLEKWEKSTAADSLLIIDNLNEEYTEWNNMLNNVGTTASITGLVTLLDKTGITGTVVTLLGAGSALLLENHEEELAKALQNGRYNIRLSTTYNKATKISIRYDYFEGWNDKYYINKYAPNGLYRNEFIQDIDIKKLYFDSNNKIWYYIDENGDKIYA